MHPVAATVAATALADHDRVQSVVSAAFRLLVTLEHGTLRATLGHEAPGVASELAQRRHQEYSRQPEDDIDEEVHEVYLPSRHDVASCAKPEANQRRSPSGAAAPVASGSQAAVAMPQVFKRQIGQSTTLPDRLSTTSNHRQDVEVCAHASPRSTKSVVVQDEDEAFSSRRAAKSYVVQDEEFSPRRATESCILQDEDEAFSPRRISSSSRRSRKKSSLLDRRISFSGRKSTRSGLSDQESEYDLEAFADTLSVANMLSSDASTKIGDCLIRQAWNLDEDLSQQVANRPLQELQGELPLEIDRVIKKMSGAWSVVRGSTSRTGKTIDLSMASSVALFTSRASLGLALPVDPDGSVKLVWDFCCLLMVLFDMIMTPLLVFVLPADSLDAKWSAPVAAFWSLDILVNFTTAVYIENVRHTEFRVIAHHYASRWMLPDLGVVLLDLVTLGMSAYQRDLGMVRPIKMLRAVRLLRVIKVETMLQKHVKRLNSLNLMLLLQLLQLICAFLLLNHLMACIWIAIGQSSKRDGWLSSVNDDVQTIYLMALHWSVTQFHGNMGIEPVTFPERAFAVCSLLLGMLAAAIFVSCTTDMILQVRHARRKTTDRTRLLNSYFSRHGISTKLVLSAKRYLSHGIQGEELVNEHELLQPFPKLLRKVILLEARQTTIQGHFLFAWLKDAHLIVFRDLCFSAFESIQYPSAHSVFFVGDACHEMFFVQSGQCRYLLQKAEQKQRHSSKGSTWLDKDGVLMSQLASFLGDKIGPHGWICEPALWIKGWRNQGSLIPISDCVLLALSESKLADVLVEFPSVLYDVILYVHWAVDSSQGQQTMTDLWKPQLGRARVRPSRPE